MADDKSRIADLFTWAADTAGRGAEALPEHVRRTALTVICDDLAAMVAAHAEPEVRAMTAHATVGPAEATPVGTPGRRAERRRVALANAVAANWSELDGGYRPATCHGSLYTLPTALAEVEANQGNLGDLVAAMVIGYEVVTRIARAYRQQVPPVLHPHATLSPIGAAAALATARRLSAAAFDRTVLGAASMSLGGPFRHAMEGATIRNAWAGAGAQLGFLAADAADAGLTASPTVLHEVFVRAGGATPRTTALTEALGVRYGIQDAYQKSYACCQYLHSSVEAAVRLAADLSQTGPPVTAIEVRTHPLAAALDNAAPATTLAGRFSLPHAVATVLHARDTSPSVFSAGSLTDPEVARLRALVRIEEWDRPPGPPHDRPSTVRVTLADGTRLEETVLSAAGGPDRPLSRDQLNAKHEMLTAERCPGFTDQARILTDPNRSPDLATPLRGLLDTLLGVDLR